MRYSTFKYGSGQKYGITENPNMLWAFEVDWDGDGVFDGQNEAVDINSLRTGRGRSYLLRSDGSGFEPVAVGTVTIDLDNADGRYDPWNTNSPLYGQIMPGRKFRLTVMIGAGGVRKAIITGVMGDLEPVSGEANKATFYGVCGVQVLKDQDVGVAIQQDISIGSAIDAILTGVDWPATWGRDLETNIDELPFWWVEENSAWEAIQSLSDAALGTFFVAADGQARFYTRHHVATPILELDQDDLIDEVTLPQPWESLRNRIQVSVRNRTLQATSVLWSFKEKTWIGSGENLDLTASFAYGGQACPALTVITPVAGADYTFHSKSSLTDPGNEDLTSNLSIEITALGNRAQLTLSNTGAKGGYVTLLQIRGDALTTGDVITVTAENMAGYGRLFKLDSPWMQQISAAQSYADFLLSFLGSPHPFPRIQIQGRPDIQFTAELFDVVHLSLPAKGIDQDFRVGQIEHRWLAASGQSVLTTLYLEPFVDIAGDYWQFPTAIGQTSVFAF